MRDIRIEKGINKGNALLLCEWSNEQGKEFQEQWMGPKISYPLDYDKIKDLGNVFSIFNQGEFIGMIQEVRIGEDNIHIGRFVIDPRKTGLGLGTEALKRFVDFILEDDNIKSISLTVFDFNQKAKRIYEKLGFEINEVIETPRLKYIMKRYRLFRVYLTQCDRVVLLLFLDFILIVKRGTQVYLGSCIPCFLICLIIIFHRLFLVDLLFIFPFPIVEICPYKRMHKTSLVW